MHNTKIAIKNDHQFKNNRPLSDTPTSKKLIDFIIMKSPQYIFTYNNKNFFLKCTNIMYCFYNEYYTIVFIWVIKKLTFIR